MTGRDIFKIWAPTGAKWIDWIRPVLFLEINNKSNELSIVNLSVPKIFYAKKAKRDTAIILDLPSYESIPEAIALAKIGWRPIPLYNGTMEQNSAMALVDNQDIILALIWGAEELKKIEMNNDSPPVFLLDSYRTNRHKMNIGVFDNSWDLYEQDIPSANYFLDNGINKIIIKGDKTQKDLIKILYKFQKKGIEIFFTNGYSEIKKVSLKKPFRKDH